MECKSLTLYINNEELGLESYIGTFDQFRSAMIETFRDSYQEYKNECIFDGVDYISFDEWVEDALDSGLEEATEDEIKKFDRLID